MVDTIISFNTVTSTGVDLAAGDNFILLDNASYVNSTAGSGIDIIGNSADVIINGDYVFLGSSDAIASIPDAASASVTVSDTGSIVTDDTGEIVFLQGAAPHVTNDGFMSGAALSITGAGATLVNGGTIRGTTTSFTTVFMTGTNPFFENSGIVSGQFGVQMADVAILNNTGEINTVDRAIRASGTSLDLLNTGLISSGSQLAILGSGATLINATNSGTINGDISFGTGADTFTAHGNSLVVGDILGSGGNDVFDLRAGTVTGSVSGGDDDDTFMVGANAPQLVETAGQGIDEVQATHGFALGDNFENLTLIGHGDNRGVGNAEANTLTGNAGSNRLGGSGGADTVDGGQGNDSLYGGAGNDSLIGGEGDDYLSAGASADTLLGGDGDDVLLGRRGVDFLNGGNGADLLEGGTGDDVLLGGRDNDTLIGGAGADTLNGGSGNDTFVFENAGDSPNSGGRDVILSFEVGLDRIDMSAINSGVMEINIGGGLSGAGTPSLRTFETSGGDTRVYVDSDGDNNTDMRIDVLGVVGLTGVDFLI